MKRGEGRVLSAPGVYHYPSSAARLPAVNALRVRRESVDSLCGVTSGIVYNEDTLHNLFTDERLCRRCERKSADG